MRFYTLLIAFALIALVIAESSTTSKSETTSGSTSGKDGSTSGTRETTGGSTTGEKDGDKVSDDGNAEYDRTIQKTNDSGDDVEFESRDKAGLSENRLKFRITTHDGEVEVRLQLEGRDDNGKAESHFRFEVEKIIEYVDNNTVSGYQAGEEVSVIDFTKKQLTWNQIDCFVNGTTYVCEVASADGQFMLVAYLTSESVIVAGQPVRPTGAKVDIQINKLKRSANTKIAVQIKLGSSVEKQTEENESDEQKEGFTKSSEKQVSFGDSAFFSWVKTATINGVTVNVLNSALEQVASGDVESGEHGNRVIFSFDSTEQGPIVWDPKLSWSADSLTSSVAAVVPCFALLSFLAAMLF